jgi:hypothetical protein
MSDRPTGTGGDTSRIEALRALQWLREQHPDARIASKLIPSDDAFVAVRIKIEIEDGPSGSAHGVAMTIEEAEDRGIVRALEVIGYRADASAVSDDVESEEDESPAPAPVAAQPRAVTPDPAPTPAEMPTRAQTPAQPSAPAPDPVSGRGSGQQPAPLAGRAAQMGPPVMVRPRQPAPSQQRPVQGRGGLRPVPDPPETEARLEDVSWTEFWKWARARGFDSRDAVNDAIGRPMDGMTPRQVRDLLKGQLGDDE